MALLLALLLSQAPSAPVPGGQRVDAPATWVAFSAELKITHPTRPLAFGRQLQDEHGCMRRETVHPDGSLIVSISNYETARMYSLIRGMWTKREIRLIPGTSRRPPTRPVGRLVRRIDGFDAYRSVSTVRSSRGDYRQEYIVIPALNFFVAEQTRPNGETIVAQNIRLGPVDHSEFLPPAGAAIADRPGFGGGQFSAVALKVVFPDRDPVEVTTTEEKPVDVRTSLDEAVQVVTSIIDDAKGLVRVRIFKNATGSPTAGIKGNLLDEVQVALGATGQTTKLPMNFLVTVTRIRNRSAR